MAPQVSGKVQGKAMRDDFLIDETSGDESAWEYGLCAAHTPMPMQSKPVNVTIPPIKGFRTKPDPRHRNRMAAQRAAAPQNGTDQMWPNWFSICNPEDGGHRNCGADMLVLKHGGGNSQGMPASWKNGGNHAVNDERDAGMLHPSFFGGMDANAHPAERRCRSCSNLCDDDEDPHVP
mmetsp:Transcript_30957/g.60779  ORF Transcript_30957/g.60779 Transcript_30957/m.60779 type:complete len:177 (-) Transcript_30957:144-674(-)